uniref:Uncharacterized protein n=1 Tax=Vitis vinifera TaxID=29760 RepID=F6HHB2_VITVI
MSINFMFHFSEFLVARLMDAWKKDVNHHPSLNSLSSSFYLLSLSLFLYSFFSS